MKKLYLFLFSLVCIAFASQAQRDYTFKFTIEEPEFVTVKICDYYDASKVLMDVELQKGLNEFAFTSEDGAKLYITPVEGKVLKVHEADGSVNYDVKNNEYELYLSSFSWSWGPTDFEYTIKTFDEATFRPNTVKVTLDNPDGIRMTLRGGNVINTDTVEYNIPFNADYEDMLTIRKANAEDLIYKITANGEEVFKEFLEYNIPLVDRSDIDDIKYITDIVITQEFPEGMMYTVKFIFTNGDPGCVSSVTYDGEPITDFAAEDGFKVRPGKKLEVAFDAQNYNVTSYQKDEREPVESDYGISSTSEIIGNDFTLKVTAEKYQELTAILAVDDPAGVKASMGSYPNTIVFDLVAGDNEIPFSSKKWANEFKVEARDGYEITKIYNATKDEEIVKSSWSSYTTIYLEDQTRYEVSTAKIYRDKLFAVYVDDISTLWSDYVSVGRGGVALQTEIGYNVFDYRDEDGTVSFNASGASNDKAKFYRNGEQMEVAYASYFSISDLKDNDVIKMFLVGENAIEHTVTFDMVEGTLDGYEVKKDILAAVDVTEPVKAVGKTQFTIAPVSREGANLTVTVGDTTIEAVDGVYTFETEGDTTVKVTNQTSGIENVISGENNNADVYNLQGIRVARQADAADINALPAGIYVVNGQKVVVK